MPTSDIDRAIKLLPKFLSIEPSAIVDDLNKLVEQNRADIDLLMATEGELNWDTFVAPFEEIGDRLSRFWSPIGHLHGVADSEQLRGAYTEAVLILTEYATEIAQSDRLFAAFAQLRESPDFDSLMPGQQKVIDNALRDFRLGGIALDESKRERFRELNAELATLTTRFSENVLDATQAWEKNIEDIHKKGSQPIQDQKDFSGNRPKFHDIR